MMFWRLAQERTAISHRLTSWGYGRLNWWGQRDGPQEPFKNEQVRSVVYCTEKPDGGSGGKPSGRDSVFSILCKISDHLYFIWQMGNYVKKWLEKQNVNGKRMLSASEKAHIPIDTFWCSQHSWDSVWNYSLKSPAQRPICTHNPGAKLFDSTKIELLSWKLSVQLFNCI